MLALLIPLLLIPLLYIPGVALARALFADHQATHPLERYSEPLLIGALLNGWVAFLLAQLGIFSLWLHLCVVLAVSGIAFWLNKRRFLSATVIPLPPDYTTRQRLTQHWPTVALLVIVLGFWGLVSRPFETILGVRDAGVYATTGFAIARTGGIVQFDPLAAQILTDQQSTDRTLVAAAEQAETNFLGVAHAERWIATRLRAAGYMFHEGDLAIGRVVPQFFHLFAAWIALLTSMFGQYGGMFATSLMGTLGLLGVALLAQRLAGPYVALLAALLLALNGVQVWFSRYTTSEAAAQFLTFTGFYFFAVMQTVPQRARGAALLAGIALGQLLLVRIDALFLIVPLIVGYLLYLLLTHRWRAEQTALALGLGAMILHAALNVTLIARAYFFDTSFARLQDYALVALASMPFITETLQVYYLTRPGTVVGIRLGPGQGLFNVRRIVIESIAMLGVLVTYSVAWRWGRGLFAHVEGLLLRIARPLLTLSALGIVVVAAYAYVVRPQILTPAVLQALPSCLAPAQLQAPAGACLALQGFIGAPIALPSDMRPVFAIPLANFVRFGWYLSPLGIALGVLGLALWWRNLNRASWLFLVAGLFATFFWVRQSYGTSDQTYIYILRRYMPFVYPLFCLTIAYAVVWLWNSAATWRQRFWVFWSVRGLALGCSLALILFLAVTNRTIYRHVEYGGAIDQVAAIASRFQPNDIVLLRGGAPSPAIYRDMPDLLATPLIYGHGVNAFTVKSREPGRYAEQLARYVQHWQSQGHTVYALLSASGALALPGIQFEPVERLGLQLKEFEALNEQKPTNIQDFTLDYILYRLTANPLQSAAVSIAPTDYAAQVRGFWRPEPIAGTLLAWTDGDAQLRLPLINRGPQQLRIELAGGKRPASIGLAQVCVDAWPETNYLAETAEPPPPTARLGCLELSEALQSYTLAIPPTAANVPSSVTTLRLRLTTTSWVPARTPSEPPATDERSLGVQFGGLSLVPISNR